MKPNIVDGVKKLIRNRVGSLDRLSISWFGGEPLLAKGVVLDVGKHAYDLCRQQGVQLGAGLTTNGYLLDPTTFAELLAINHNEYQITLDGDEEWHDKTRVLANRRPTFEKIWANLEGCRKAAGHFNITLRLHVHHDNVESVKRLYERLKLDLLADRRFGVYFHKVSNLSPGSAIKERVLGRDEYIRALDYITGSGAGERPSAPAGAISEEHLSGYICYAAKPTR